ncbi:flavin reductase family protein [Nocardiopsis lambiniae]|uniref:Flavin reductase family protein n=1 Tax=Nocardiopsis lambiniae TaxID=3075539 RepID=A0ABU2MC65_9ACTN|nr:flavin reductase family protein [Nocardiopsis sp. DSM 44743]MDT0330162.1 flavin reductase family protein [Nocardiopsis sp. DSM 44743]
MLTEDVFRDLMAGVCAPVTIVTAMDGGTPHGTTVSSFGSLSLRPPMVTVALGRGSRLLDRILRTRRFGVNVLGVGGEEVARVFAGRGEDRFRGVAWRAEHGLPRLDRVVGWAVCELDRAVPGGDHVLLMGVVVNADSTGASSLVYGNREFGTHSEHARMPRVLNDHILAFTRH